jgi:radical SAM superfamily enzyme YgiQ (UPF0313 family)
MPPNKTSDLRITIIGHTVTEKLAFKLSNNENKAAVQVGASNFTRVELKDGSFIDHIEYLNRRKHQEEIPKNFSVWDMYLCSVLSLESYLIRNKFRVQKINHIDENNKEKVDADIRSFGPNIILISTTFVLSKKHLFAIGKNIKMSCPDAFLLGGGHHILTTLLYMDEQEKKDYLDDSGFDGFIEDSQGEGSLLKLCNSFPNELEKVPNLTWKDKKNKLWVNLRVPENNDINLTSIDLTTVPENSVIHIRTARSCSFKCAFCSYPTIAGDLASMDIDNVLPTLIKAKERKAKAIFFVDDTFNVPSDRFEGLLDLMIKNDIKIPWYSFLRCQYVTREIVEKMSKSGCKGVFLGIESGSNKILKNMKKGAIVDFYRDGIKWLNEFSITSIGSFLVGFPGETKETVNETREFIENSGLNYYFIQPFYYLHHTPIFKNANNYGLEGEGLFWEHDTMNWREAISHVNEMFFSIKGSEFINPDYTLWEYAYLISNGYSNKDFKDYRREINHLTRQQMIKHSIHQGNVTSRTT